MWFIFLVSTLPKNFPSTLPAVYGDPSLISVCLSLALHQIHSVSIHVPCNRAVPLGLLFLIDSARGFSFGHCLLPLLLFSSPAWVLSKEQSSGLPNLMRFHSTLSMLLFIEASRKRTHNCCSPEQMFFREGHCMQGVSKISVTLREILGQIFFFMDPILLLWLLSEQLHACRSACSLERGGKCSRALVFPNHSHLEKTDLILQFLAHIRAIAPHRGLARHGPGRRGVEGRER